MIGKKITKVLIVKIAAIGDVIMALQMLEAIKSIYIDAKITWVCGRTAAPIIKYYGCENELIIIDEEKLLAGSLIDKCLVLIGIWFKLFMRFFDLIVIGNADSRYKLMTLSTRCGIKRSFRRNFKNRIWPIPGRYHGDEYVRLITGIEGPKQLGFKIAGLKIPLPERCRELMGCSNKPIVTLAPGGAKNVMSDDVIRRWPIQHYIDLAGILLKRGIGVVIVGGKTDYWVSDAFGSMDVVNLIGKTDLRELVSVFCASDIIITHDSGPLQLAILADKPVIALFGPTLPREKIPHSDKITVLYKGEKLRCSPCYDGRTYADCNDNVCMKNISVEQVENCVLKIINKSENLGIL